MGAVLARDKHLVGLGYNGFPARFNDDGRLEEKETKMLLMIHAERNAIKEAGPRTDGATLYTTKYPCHDCAKEMILYGVRDFWSPNPITATGLSLTTRAMLLEAGITHHLWK